MVTRGTRADARPGAPTYGLLCRISTTEGWMGGLGLRYGRRRGMSWRAAELIERDNPYIFKM